MSVSPTPEEAAAALIRKRLTFGGTYGAPETVAALDVLVAALRDARRSLGECEQAGANVRELWERAEADNQKLRDALERIARNAENNGDEFTRMLARAAAGSAAAEETQP